jgi:hypothetical protein
LPGLPYGYSFEFAAKEKNIASADFNSFLFGGKNNHEIFF